MEQPTAPRIAGHLALDWLNTLIQTGEGPNDFLSTDEQVRRWLLDSGTGLDRLASLRPQGTLSARARDLREVVRELVNHRRAGSRGDPSALNAFLAAGAARERVVWKPGTRVPTRQKVYVENSAESALAPVAEAAADLLCGEDFGAVKKCENPACTLLFRDPTATQRRRWCDMAVCGNRMKVAAFRARAREA